MQPGTKAFLIAAGAGLLLFLLLIGGVVGFLHFSDQPATTHRRAEKKAGGATKKDEYPYPECDACMKWFRENLPEPGSLELISWKKIDYRDKNIDFQIEAKFRAKNEQGGFSVATRRFHFKDGRLTGGHTYQD